MNEELKIIIKAVSTDAKKNLEGVKKELTKIEGEGQKAKKSLGETMKVVAKGAAAAVATITALTAAMVSLGKAAVEAQKGISKLNNAFESNGSTVKQAGATYKELFGFLGDSDKAVEAAQSLALITQNKDELKEYETILKGVYASMGDKLPVEGLAEAINATIQIGQVDGVMADAIEWMGISLDGFNAALKEASTIEEREVLVRSTLNGLYSNSAALYDRNNQATIQYNKSQAELNLRLAEATRYTAPLMTSLNNLSSTLLTFFGPALQTVATYLTAFIQLIAEAIQWVGSFFGMFGGKSESAAADFKGYYKAMDNYMSSIKSGFGSTNDTLEETSKQLKEIKKQTMGFDELNIVSNPSTSGASGGGGGGGVPGIGAIPSAPNPADFGIGGDDLGFENLKKNIEEAKEKLKALLILVGLLGAGFAAWKIASIVNDISVAKALMENMNDGMLFQKIFGENAEAYLENMKSKLMGVTGIIMIVVGALILAWGWMDAWVNGIDWGNLAAILGGLALIVGGVALKFGGLATPIALVAAGIIALIIGIKDLITNGYSMEAVIMVTVGAIAVLIGVIWAMNAALLANPITWIVVAIMALVAAVVILWNECDWFREAIIASWDWIVNAFKAVVKFLKDAWQEIKNTFSVVGEWFSNIFSQAWNGIKKAFSAVGSFFKNLWNDIKSIFSNIGSTIGNAISNTVKAAINSVLSIAIKTINGFISAINLAIGVINAIPGVEIKKLTKLSVPKLATGGIITGESLFIGGEGGKKEAVLPLEQNTEWMDILADRIAGRNSAPTKIALVVDGKELGWASINGINGITRQTGTLPLELSLV